MSQLRIATFNLLHGQPMDAHGRPLPLHAEDPAAPLAEAIAALDADVLALQEVDRFQERSGLVDQAAVAAKALGARDHRFAAAVVGRPAPVAGWVHAPDATALRVYGPDSSERDVDQPAYGTALVTRLPVLHWRARRFPAAPFGLPLRVAGRRGLTPVPDEPRAALAAVLEGPAGPFTALAAHLSFVPGWNMGQLAGMRRWIADLPAPYLLLGDFNLIGPVPRTVLGGASVVDGSRLRTRRPLRAASPRGRLQGWRDLARTPTYPAHKPTVQFDHVLAVGVPRTAVQRIETPTTSVSDHRPLLVQLSLPEASR
ncbi:endonuclease/exonuclease/phosphatase family protein [Streptacidiphilus rugosus]|uniref:endonuclease/exonuclease/phosphatase family protein n=1 Tax=Streptacidiphilus rugosus TaxID=405783 RepID=UPI000A747F6C|nr:endonuclease/exonuclease/phosphatase family protein [Streptacidiphilus rugosus]